MEKSALQKLEKFFGKYPVKKYPRKETILQAEEEPKGVFFLQKGFVRFYSLSPEGRGLTLNIFKPGSFFPMTWALAEQANVYFFETMVPSELRLAPRREVLRFLEDEPLVLRDLNRRVLVGLNGFLTRAEFLLFGNAAQRVTSVLLMAARRFGETQKGGRVIIQLPLTHQSIADLAGLTRESTSLEMKKLEREDLIYSSKKLITLKNPERIREICQLCRDETPLPYAF